jgi:Arc/MetJ-type ribon-helix-helix transcriptional regulator
MVRKVAVTLDPQAVAELDRLVEAGRFPNRSRAIQSAVDLLSERESRTRLARELAKLDPEEEKQLADEGLSDEAWPGAGRTSAGSDSESRDF